MCSNSCLIFGARNLGKKEVKDKKVLEVGSCDVNGSLRPIIESWGPAEYIGVDIIKGPGVDMICDVKDLVKTFGKEKFGLIIATELLEHVRDWKRAISNIKNVCQREGVVLITTRSYGKGYHGYPDDFWRYEVKDMRNIFSDFQVLSLEKDKQEPGVFIKVKKPKKFIEKDLSGYKLYSIVANKRVTELEEKHFKSFYFTRLAIKGRLKIFIAKKKRLKHFLEMIASLVQD